MEGYMDYDDKIRTDNQGEYNKVQIFLKDTIKTIRQDTPVAYNIEEEFAKTRNNRDFFPVFVIIAVAIIVISGAWIVTSIINKSSKNVSVDIAVFEDLNLKNVLDLAKKAEANLDSIIQQRVNRQSDYQTDLANIERQYTSELEILAAQRLTNADRQAKRRSLDQAYEKDKKELQTQYALAMTKLDQAFEDAKTQVESFDKKRIEEAREQKKLLDNQQDVYELEKQRIKDSYEKEIVTLRDRMEKVQDENFKLKADQIKNLVDEYQARIAELDPQWNDIIADTYIAEIQRYGDAQLPFRSPPMVIPDMLNVPLSDFSSLARGYEGLGYLLTQAGGIPFENEAGDYVRSGLKIALVAGAAGEHIINLSFESLTSLEKQLVSEKTIRGRAEKDRNDALAKNTELEKKYKENQERLAQILAEYQKTQTAYTLAQNTLIYYESLLQAALIQHEYDGFVIDVADPQSPKFYIAPEKTQEIPESASLRVYLYRPPKTLQGEIELSKDATGLVFISSMNLKKGKNVLAFDYISFKKR